MTGTSACTNIRPNALFQLSFVALLSGQNCVQKFDKLCCEKAVAEFLRTLPYAPPQPPRWEIRRRY